MLWSYKKLLWSIWVLMFGLALYFYFKLIWDAKDSMVVKYTGGGNIVM